MLSAGVLLDQLLPFHLIKSSLYKLITVLRILPREEVCPLLTGFIFTQAEYVLKGVKLDEQMLFIKLILSLDIIRAFQRLNWGQMWTKKDN